MPQIPLPSAFASKLAGIAQDQYQRFHLIDESHEPLRSQIEQYWNDLPDDFPGVVTPWSAVFISYCVRHAGATSAEFKFAAAHSVFVHEAIVHPCAFKGVALPSDSVRVGDILQNNRSGNNFDFAYASTHSEYESHSAIIVARGEDHLGKYAMAVGGNESNSVRMNRIQLNDDGSVRQRTNSPFICLLKNRK